MFLRFYGGCFRAEEEDMECATVRTVACKSIGGRVRPARTDRSGLRSCRAQVPGPWWICLANEEPRDETRGKQGAPVGGVGGVEKNARTSSVFLSISGVKRLAVLASLGTGRSWLI
jgi:hypothetical protein